MQSFEYCADVDQADVFVTDDDNITKRNVSFWDMTAGKNRETYDRRICDKKYKCLGITDTT